MNALVLFALIAFAHAAVSAPAGVEEFIAEKCAPEDAECFTRGVKVFLKKIADGVPKLEIKPFEPVEFEHIKVNIGEDHFAEFKNVKITGFKEQDVTDFVIAKDTDKLKSKLSFVADATAFVKGEKEHEFPYKLKATVSGSATYPKEIKKDDDGKEYIVLGEETITCEVEGTPEVTVAESDRAGVVADAKLQPLKKYFEEAVEETRKKIACAFFEEGFKAVGSNMRKFLAAVPKDDLYKN